MDLSVPPPVSGLREEELVRSGGREGRKKLLPGGSGSGDLDDVTDALLGVPTVLYQDTSTATTQPLTSTTTRTSTVATSTVTSSTIIAGRTDNTGSAILLLYTISE